MCLNGVDCNTQVQGPRLMRTKTVRNLYGNSASLDTTDVRTVS